MAWPNADTHHNAITPTVQTCALFVSRFRDEGARACNLHVSIVPCSPEAPQVVEVCLLKISARSMGQAVIEVNQIMSLRPHALNLTHSWLPERPEAAVGLNELSELLNAAQFCQINLLYHVEQLFVMRHYLEKIPIGLGR